MPPFGSIPGSATASNNTTRAFELIHSDVWGPSFYASMDGYRYYISFLDDFTKYLWVYPMKQKYEVSNIFKHFNSYVERNFNIKIKSIQTDLGTEYKPLYDLFA